QRPRSDEVGHHHAVQIDPTGSGAEPLVMGVRTIDVCADLHHIGAVCPQVGVNPLAPGVVCPDQGDSAVLLRGEYPRLGRNIPLHAAVPVEVVGTDVGQDGHVGGEGGGQVQLVAGDLDDVDGVRGRLRQGQDADADIAADVDGQ